MQDRRLRRDSAPSIAAIIATVAGVVNLASIVWPSFDDSSAVQTLLPGFGQWAVSRPTEVATSAAVGAGLLVLAGGLRRGLRWAWLATLALLAGGVVIHLSGRGGAGEAVLEAAFFGWLAGKSRSFRARRGPGDRRRIVLPLLELLALTAVYGLVGLAVNSPEFLRDQGVLGALGQVSRMAVGFGASEPLPGAFGRFFPGSVAALFLTGMVLIVLRALAPRRVVSAPPPTPEELCASDDSLAYFATRDDRVTVRVRDGIVSYGAARSVALAAGDPLGPRDAWPAVVDGFLAQAAATGRVPAVLGCSRQAAKIYRAAGMRRIYLGDEAILYLATFDIETPGRKRAREGWRRGQREGMTAALTRSGDLSAAETDELKALSERWLGETKERGFSMALSRLFDPRDADTWFLVARDHEGHASGFIHLVPWAADGAGVDAMRRDREAPNVINDFLIVEAARLLPGRRRNPALTELRLPEGPAGGGGARGSAVVDATAGPRPSGAVGPVPDRVALSLQREVRSAMAPTLRVRAIRRGRVARCARHGPRGGPTPSSVGPLAPRARHGEAGAGHDGDPPRRGRRRGGGSGSPVRARCPVAGRSGARCPGPDARAMGGARVFARLRAG